MPEISIIVPVYNVENYLHRCVDSILAQTFTDFELLLIDDGSPDNSGAICDEYAAKDSRVRVFHKENGGVSSARNLGLDNARGEYIMFCDSDDEVLPQLIENIMKLTDVDYVIEGLTHVCSDADERIRKTTMFPSAGIGYESMPDDFFTLGVMHSCCGKRYKANVIKDYNIVFPNFRLSEDSFFNLYYIEKLKTWEIIDKCDYCYIHRANFSSATSNYDPCDIDTYILLHKQMNSMRIRKEAVKGTLYAQYLSCIVKCYKSNADWAARRAQMKEILSKPGVKKTLLYTKRNLGEWISGLVYCTCNQRMISAWIWLTSKI